MAIVESKTYLSFSQFVKNVILAIDVYFDRLKHGKMFGADFVDMCDILVDQILVFKTLQQ